MNGVLRKIPQFLPGFFNLQSSLSRYSNLVFRILKICLAVPSGSHYYFMVQYGYAYKLRLLPYWEGVGID